MNRIVKEIRQCITKDNWKLYLYFAIVFVIFLFTRLYQITELPGGLHIDEVSMGYNTWSLSEFGTDRYGVSYPVYFNNAGSGQSSLYVYLAVLLSKIFGYSIFLLRFVAVLFGIMLLVFATLTAYEIAGMTCAKAMSLIITVMPYFIMSERWAFDCNAMLPVFVMSLYFLIKLLKTNKTKYAVFTGLSLALTMYSYILAFFIVPVFVLLSLLLLFVSKNTLKISMKNFLIMTCSGLVMVCPIVLYGCVVIGLLPEFQLGPISFTAASAGRMSEIYWQGLSPSELFQQICNLMTYDKYHFTADKNYGVFYMNKLQLFGCEVYLTQLLLILGFLFLVVMCIYKFVKQKQIHFGVFVVAYILASLTPMFFIKGFAIYRYNAIFFGFAFILAYIFTFLWQHKALVCSLLCVVLLCGNFYSYATYLFTGGFQEDYPSLDYFDSELLDIFEHYDDLGLDAYDVVYVDDITVYNPSLVVLYGMRTTPDEVQKCVKNVDTKEMIYKNIHVGIPETVNEDENALYIIRDANADTLLYTNSYEQLNLYQKLAAINNTRQQLQEKGWKQTIYNHYFMFSAS